MYYTVSVSYCCKLGPFSPCLPRERTTLEPTNPSKSRRRRLHTTQQLVYENTRSFSKTMFVNGERIRTEWVCYLVSWADIFLSHRCQWVFCPWQSMQIAQINDVISLTQTFNRILYVRMYVCMYACIYLLNCT